MPVPTSCLTRSSTQHKETRVVTTWRKMKLSPLYLLPIGACFLLMIVEGQAVTSECIRLRNNADCSFYTRCVERNKPCGSSGYALGYGYHFCSAFSQYSSQFTPQVAKCLLCTLPYKCFNITFFFFLWVNVFRFCIDR